MWFRRKRPDNEIEAGRIRTEANAKDKQGVPEGVWNKCPNCDAALYHSGLEKNLLVCPECDYHIRISARQRIAQLLDSENQQELAKDIEPIDMLKFKDTKSYKDRLSDSQKKTGETDALIVVAGEIKKTPVVVAVFEFAFQGGSMGSVVGAKFVKAAEYALQNSVPLICVTASGGARMQESLFSLMQMVKVSAIIAKLKAVSIPYIVILTDPTTGGVSASLAMLGDIHIAEPKALIGFAGPRVIEQTVREKLPEGFQRSEFLQEKGMVDMIVDRRNLCHELSDIISKLLKLTLTNESEPDEAA